VQRYVVFDLGGVLIDWNPRYLYRQLLPAPEVERFLGEVATPEWNVQMDEGKPFAEAIAERKADHPEHGALLDAYFDRWDEMLGGAIDGTVRILERLHAEGVPLYALTNWSAETFPHAERRFEFLALFRDILVSGVERMVKPNPSIYRRLLDRNHLPPADGVFIDDNLPNVHGAEGVGLTAIHFRNPEQLQPELDRFLGR
jgi:2-haloacid dehalogenase